MTLKGTSNFIMCISRTARTLLNQWDIVYLDSLAGNGPTLPSNEPAEPDPAAVREPRRAGRRLREPNMPKNYIKCQEHQTRAPQSEEYVHRQQVSGPWPCLFSGYVSYTAYYCYCYYYYYTHLMTSFPGQPGETSTRKVKLVWIKNEARDGVFWDAVASAWPYANNLHLAPDRPPHHSILQAGCSSWHPTNSVKALKAPTHN